MRLIISDIRQTNEVNNMSDGDSQKLYQTITPCNVFKMWKNTAFIRRFQAGHKCFCCCLKHFFFWCLVVSALAMGVFNSGRAKKKKSLRQYKWDLSISYWLIFYAIVWKLESKCLYRDLRHEWCALATMAKENCDENDANSHTLRQHFRRQG